MDEERRQGWVCSAHSRMEEKLDTGFHDIGVKLDDIVERQLDYIQRLTRIEDKQEQIEKIVTNGLSHNVANIAKRLDSFCEEVKKRLDELEEFKWFRKPVTAWRDSFFLTALKVSMIGALIYVVVHFGKELLKWVIT